MSERLECEICHMTFKDEQGLMQHKQAKHPVEEKPRINTRKVRNWAIFIVIIALIAAGLTWVIASTYKGINYCKTAPASEINIGAHTNLALHHHADLEIIIDGVKQTIPTNIGVLPGIMRPIHTHDASGEIHLEGPCQRDFKLGEFFEIWGKEFSSEKIFDKNVDSGVLTMKANNAKNNEFENYVIKDSDEIVIEFKSN